ncbi:MAG: hypothetical protein U1F66_11580 [bacterium]
MATANPYSLFARVLNYPWPGEKAEVTGSVRELTRIYPEVGEVFQPFAEYLAGISEERLQELYTQTFEIQPLCHLDVGYVLFGEDYKRGQFLVHLKQEHEKIRNECGSELPDHLPNFLNLLARHPDREFAGELAREFLIPALEKMLGGFKEKGNVYGAPLQALSAVLRRDYAEPAPAVAEKGNLQ